MGIAIWTTFILQIPLPSWISSTFEASSLKCMMVSLALFHLKSNVGWSHLSLQHHHCFIRCWCCSISSIIMVGITLYVKTRWMNPFFQHDTPRAAKCNIPYPCRQLERVWTPSDIGQWFHLPSTWSIQSAFDGELKMIWSVDSLEFWKKRMSMQSM